MKRYILNTVIATCFALWHIPASTVAQDDSFAQGRLLIKFTNRVNPVISKDSTGVVLFSIPAVDRLNDRYGCHSVRNLLPGRKNRQPAIYLLKFRGSPDIRKLVAEYFQTGCFAYVEPDYSGRAFGGQSFTAVPNDPYFYRQWSLHNEGVFLYAQAKAGADIDMPAAWEIEQGDPNTIAGIIDTGGKLDHPEFAGRIWTNTGEIPGNGVDDDGNGYIDDVSGWNFSYDNNDPMDDMGHGTAVATIIGASGNNLMGYAGINWFCRLMTIKAFDSTGYSFYSQWIEAIHYAVDNGARVLNMSFGGGTNSQALHDAIDYALTNNVTCVAAMGNLNTSMPLYPAANSGVIAVGSTSADDTRSVPFCLGAEPGSNFGAHISVVAPGNLIFVLDFRHDYEYFYAWCGTSFATPHVVGVASLLLAQNPALTPAQIKSGIESSAEDLVGDPYEDTPGWDPYYGHGRLNAYQALTLKNAQKVPERVAGALKFYPNPTTGSFSLITPGIPAESQPEIIITDILGNIHFRGQLMHGQTDIDLTSKPDGVYTVLLTSGPMCRSGKVVVMK